jgi:hypothetical protein
VRRVLGLFPGAGGYSWWAVPGVRDRGLCSGGCVCGGLCVLLLLVLFKHLVQKKKLG